MQQRKNNRTSVLDRDKRLEELEGKYFLFDYSADYTSEGSATSGEALEIFQVRKGKLEEIWHPCDNAFMNIIGEAQSEKACEYLKKHNIKTVYTPGWTKDPSKFLNITFDNYTDKNNWVNYEPLTEQIEYWQGFLKGRDITLKVYDEEKPPKTIDELLRKIANSPNQPKNAQ